MSGGLADLDSDWAVSRHGLLARQTINHIIRRSRRLHHMLRHACGFYLANQGYDLRLIQDYLGHRDPK